MLEKNYFCELDNKYHNKITIVRILKKHNINIKEYYDTHYKKENEGFCLFCGKEIPFIKFSYKTFCDHSCCGKYNNPLGKYWEKLNQNEELKKKQINKMISSRMANNDSKIMHEKRCITFLKKYGITHSEYVSRSTKHYYENITPEEQHKITEKIYKNRKMYKMHEYILNGKTILIQGYEKYVLDHLKKYFIEEDIFAERKKVPSIKYYDTYTNKERLYFPDIYIKSLNLIIEVKSTYTYDIHKNNLELKIAECIKQGYNAIVVIWNKHSKFEIEQSKNKLDEAISSQVAI